MSLPPSISIAPASATAQPMNEAVVFEDVAIGFEDKQVLNGVSFQLPRGETKAVFGAAGSGKSTLLKLALGLLKPDRGQIYTLGQDIVHMKEEDLFALRSRVGIVFQESALFDSLTVRENVAFRLYEEGDVPESQIEERVREVLRFVELEHTLDKFPAELSGGMRRRVAIARAVITQPEVLLYDSPTGGHDPVTSTTIVELIVKQRDVYKTSSLMVTHRLQDAFTMATHCFDAKSNHMQKLPHGVRNDIPMTFMILRDGKAIFDGDVEELVATKDDYIREYIS